VGRRIEHVGPTGRSGTAPEFASRCGGSYEPAFTFVAPISRSAFGASSARSSVVQFIINQPVAEPFVRGFTVLRGYSIFQ
jgi:hypothetical protein